MWMMPIAELLLRRRHDLELQVGKPQVQEELQAVYNWILYATDSDFQLNLKRESTVGVKLYSCEMYYCVL